MLYMVPDSDERDNSLTENEENTRFSGETRNQSSSSDNENEPTSSSRYQMDLAAGGFNNSAKNWLTRETDSIKESTAYL